jgi:hypothetical protein
MLLPFVPPALFLAAFFFYVAVVHPTTDSIVGPSDRPFYVATGYDTDLGVLDDRGERLSDPPAPIRAAVCRNYHDFLDDRTMRPELVIVDDPGLIRSAELLDGPYAGDQVALDTEVLYVRAGRDSFGALLQMHEDGWSDADIEHGRRYLAVRNDPPSAGAADRYVVYTTKASTWSALMVRLAVEPEAELVPKPMLDRIGDISVQLPDGSMARVNESLCWK